MRKAVIFARVSTARQEQEGLSLTEIQLPRMRKYAEEKELEIVREFVFQETADKKRRVKFDEFVHFMKKHRDVEVVIAFRVDRITRNFRDAVAMDDLRTEYDKELHFVESRLVINKDSRSYEVGRWDTEVFTAKLMINRLKEDGRNTKYSKLESGEVPGRPPFGYILEQSLVNKRVRDAVPEEFKAGIVKQMFVIYSTGTYSFDQIAKKIRDDYKAPMSKNNARKILNNRFYIGYMLDVSTGKYYPHRYEHLISEDLFNAVQAVMSGFTKRKYKYAGLPFTYRGLLQCAVCKCTITAEPKQKVQKNGNVHDYAYYHCTQKRYKHDNEWLTEDDLDAQFRKAFKGFKVPPEEIERLREVINSTHKAKNRFVEAQRGQYQAEYTKLQKRIENTYDQRADMSITPQDADDNIARYRSQQDQLLKSMKNLQNADEQYYVVASYLIKLFERADILFDHATREEKRQIIGLVCQNLLLDGKNIKFNLKKPFDTIYDHTSRMLWQPQGESNPSYHIESVVS